MLYFHFLKCSTSEPERRCSPTEQSPLKPRGTEFKIGLEIKTTKRCRFNYFLLLKSSFKKQWTFGATQVGKEHTDDALRQMVTATVNGTRGDFLGLKTVINGIKCVSFTWKTAKECFKCQQGLGVRIRGFARWPFWLSADSLLLGSTRMRRTFVFCKYWLGGPTMTRSEKNTSEMWTKQPNRAFKITFTGRGWRVWYERKEKVYCQKLHWLLKRYSQTEFCYFKIKRKCPPHISFRGFVVREIRLRENKTQWMRKRNPEMMYGRQICHRTRDDCLSYCDLKRAFSFLHQW